MLLPLGHSLCAALVFFWFPEFEEIEVSKIHRPLMTTLLVAEPVSLILDLYPTTGLLDALLLFKV